MRPQECPSYNGCSAPLCPLEPVPDAQWFPDEDICNSRAINKPQWVITQRKIQRLHLKGRLDDDRFFTVPMLQAMKKVRHPKGMLPEDLYRNATGSTARKPSISL